MFEAYTRLGSAQQLLQLVIEPKFPKKLTQIHLRNEEEQITLKHFEVEEI
jgi:hypothetical protein